MTNQQHLDNLHAERLAVLEHIADLRSHRIHLQEREDSYWQEERRLHGEWVALAAEMEQSAEIRRAA